MEFTVFFYDLTCDNIRYLYLENGNIKMSKDPVPMDVTASTAISARMSLVHTTVYTSIYIDRGF